MKQIFIFPHAGGSEISYVSLKKKLSAKLVVNIIKYPGRGSRIAEPLPENFRHLVKDCTGQIVTDKVSNEYYILGHSFGALLAYEVLCELRENDQSLPEKAFLSGRGAPSVNASTPFKHLMSNAQLIDYLSEMGGIPEELADNEDFLSFFLPIIRSDLKMNELYKNIARPQHNIPFIILHGKDDNGVKIDGINAWQDFTTYPINKMEFDGDHFFILKNELFTSKVLSYCN